jgi:hypothetical protein
MIQFDLPVTTLALYFGEYLCISQVRKDLFDGREMLEGMDFAIETDRQILSKIVEKFEEFCIGETNETYERLIFNRSNQEENESVRQYVTLVRKLAQTCNFCNCLND